MEKKKKKENIKEKLQTLQLVNSSLYIPPYELSWFETENKVSLDAYIKLLFSISNKYLKSNANPDTIKGILVPHASIQYSGLCSASAYSQVLGRTNNIKRIILLCTNHKPSNSFISTSYTDISSYTNSKPILKIDTKTIEYLKPYLQIDNNRFNEEHSFFNQLPFIEHILSEFTQSTQSTLLLPFLISNSLNLLDETVRFNIRKILNTILELLKNKDTILICTSDLSHINGEFEYKIKKNIYQKIREKDSEILQFLYNGLNGVKGRNQKLDDILFIQNAPSCGTMAIYFFAKLLNSHSGGFDYSSSSSSSSNSSGNNSPNVNKIINFETQLQSKLKTNSLKIFPRVCCYYTSLIREKLHMPTSNTKETNFNPYDLTTVLDITDILKSSISYAGLIFTTQPYIEVRKIRKIENMFSQYEKIALISFTREQIYNNFYNENKIPFVPFVPSTLILPINCQVFNQTLGIYICAYKNNKLRSCSGTVETNNDDFTILNNIKRIGIELSINKNNYKDMHFPKLDASELNKLTFQITILYHINNISINDYFGNKFNFGTDGLFIKDSKDSKSKNNNFLFSLKSIKETKQNNDSNDYNDSNNSNIISNKKTLLESLCNSELQKKNKNFLDNVKLYYNEGIIFSDNSL